MESLDVLIVGGGPAGSTCAWRLRQHGIECAILDREQFPRTKLCAGWITPEVVRDLQLEVQHYPHSFMSFHGIHVHVRGFHFKMDSLQHSIRRYEFDDWLLKRSGAPVFQHYVKDIRKENGHYIIDGQYRCKYLVGAGGTRCPVFRTLFKDTGARPKELQVVTQEQEFPYPWKDEGCHLWFFDKGLPGYAWYVPKAKGHLNVGIGGMAHKLKRRGDDIKPHWDHFTRVLGRQALVDGCGFEPGGYSYYVRGDTDVGRLDNAWVIGDAAGLATRDLCEGIGPAIQSGLRAADAIALGREYTLTDVPRYSAGNRLARKLLEYALIQRR
jgi:flavin-dependent dehydrogenase